MFYKRDGSHKWLGRVSTNRLIKDVGFKSDDVVVDQRDTNPNMSVPLQRDSSSCATSHSYVKTWVH